MRGIANKICLKCNIKNKAENEKCIGCGFKKFLSAHTFAVRNRLGMKQKLVNT